MRRFAPLFAAVAVFAAAVASADNRVTVQPMVSYTFGTDNYRGLDGSALLSVPARWNAVGFDGDLSLKPEYSGSRSDVSTGTAVTEGLTLGAQGRWVGVSLTGSQSPRVDGYLNTALGGDVSLRYPPGAASTPAAVAPETKAGPETAAPASAAPDDDRWSFVADAGVNFIHHSDDFTVVFTTTGPRGRTRTRSRDHSFDVEETDWSGSLEAARGLFDLSGEATWSSYSKDLDKVGARAALILRLPGLHSTLQGFPDQHYTARVSLDLPVVAPYVSYAYTTFKLSQPVEDSYTGGGVIDVGDLEFDASYERDVFAQHAPEQSYATLSASYLF